MWAQVPLGTVLLVLVPLVGMLALSPLFPGIVRLVWMPTFTLPIETARKM
jgi:hypothetical protein